MFSFGHLVSLIGNYVGFIKWANVCKQNMYALYVNAIFFFFFAGGARCQGCNVYTLAQHLSQLSKKLHTESNLQQSPKTKVWCKGLVRE